MNFKSTTAAILAPAKEVREGSFISFATLSYKWKCALCQEFISFELCGLLWEFVNTLLLSVLKSFPIICFDKEFWLLE